MTNVAQNEHQNTEHQSPDLVEAIAETAKELNLANGLVEQSEDAVELSPEEMRLAQQKEHEERLRKLIDGFDAEAEEDYRNRVNAYFDYLKVRSDEVNTMVLGTKVIEDSRDEPLIDTNNEAVVRYLEIQPALDLLSKAGKLPIYFMNLRSSLEKELISINYRLASMHRMDPETEKEYLYSVDNAFIYGVNMLFTLQASNVLKTLVNFHRQGVLTVENRDIYVELLDKNYKIHEKYLADLEYSEYTSSISGHYDIVRELCLSLPTVAEAKPLDEAAND